MAELQAETIKITGVSQYCVFAGQMRYGFNKPVESTMFQKGNTYSVSVATGVKGGKYISRVNADLGVLEADPNSASVLNPATNQQATAPSSTFKPWTKKPFTPKADGLSKEEWAAKDTRMSRAGAIQAAVQAVSQHCNSVETIKAMAVPLAEFIIDFAHQKDTVTK